MRRITATLALALSLLGCGSATPKGDPVQLLTAGAWRAWNGWFSLRCQWAFVEGLLIVDPSYGTAIKVERDYLGDASDTRPVMWGPGFTGVRVGSEVVVVDAGGSVVAMTGQRYRIADGPGGPGMAGPEPVNESTAPLRLVDYAGCRVIERS